MSYTSDQHLQHTIGDDDSMDLTMMHKMADPSFTTSRLSSLLHISMRHRRSSSSTTTSRTSARSRHVSTPPRRLSSSPTSFDLQHRAISTLTTMYNSPSESSSHISPDLVVERDGNDSLTSHDAFRAAWTRKLAAMPDFQLEVAEAVADEAQLKVWVRSEITGLPDGRRRESFNMMEFNEDGVLVATSGYWRPARGDDSDRVGRTTADD